MRPEGKTLCRTPNQPGGGKGTNIDTWKFEACERAIRAVFAENGGQSLGFMALIQAAKAPLSASDQVEMGSLGWFLTTVILEMQFRGHLVATKVGGRKMLALTCGE